MFAFPYDRWEGFAAERTQLLQFIQDKRLREVIFLTADMHANLIQDVRINRFSETEPLAREFVAGPIATYTLQKELTRSAGISPATVSRLRGLFGTTCAQLDAFGYGVVDLDPELGTATITLKDERGQVLEEGGCQSVIKIF